MANTIQVTMNSDNIAIMRYVIIPSVGFFIGAFFFLLIYRNYSSDFSERLETYIKEHLNRILFFAIAIYSLFFLSIIILRYFSYHVGLFDFGIYDWRIWQIHAIPWTEFPEKIKSSLAGHFQPILIVYSILYDFGVEPLILNILQAVAVLSGIIPLYLIAKTKFKNQLFTLLVSIFYLLYPATQFNIAIDFHPDHLIIPLLLWFYYLLEKGIYIWTIPLIVIGYMIKEPLILAISFMGLFIAWEKKKYVFGFILFFVSIVVFYIATFVIIPNVSNFQPYETVIGSSAFGYILKSKGFLPIIKEMLHFEKWRFPFFLLFPLLFLPFWKFKTFLPAIPLLAIPILSTVIHHQNVASHYTAGIIPPAFVSFISAIAYLHNRFGERITLGILSWIGILLLAFNVAHSPSPVAIAFWNKDWSRGKWHYTSYTKSYDKDLSKAIELIPKEPKVRVVTHSEIYDKRLAHRYFYKPFPEKWQNADYVLLDNRRGGYVMDSLNEELYFRELTKLKEDKNFKLIYSKGGVLLFRRYT